MANAIEVAGVSKCYVLGQRLGRYVTLREVVAAAVRRRGAAPPEQMWALRDVTFDVPTGEALGVIGPNGAGKTTLLKILSRIVEPTEGVSRTRGRAGALLDVGTGFHPELTGKENIYLNAAILGMSRKDVTRRYDEIVDFAGLERFLDTPLKRYSWGMYLRLAFAVAAHVEPDVVIVDEVLAVGDARFREKCLGKMAEFGREGRTVVFVSHDLGSITQVCRRALWLDRGQVQADGPSEEIVQRYVRGSVGMLAHASFDLDESRDAQLLEAAVTAEDGAPLPAPERGDPLRLAVRLAIREPRGALQIALSVRDRRGITVVDELWADGAAELPLRPVPAVLDVALQLPPLLPAGDYVLGVWLGSAYDTVLEEEALRFRILPRADDPAEATDRDRVVQPQVTWTVRRSGT